MTLNVPILIVINLIRRIDSSISLSKQILITLEILEIITGFSLEFNQIDARLSISLF